MTAIVTHSGSAGRPPADDQPDRSGLPRLPDVGTGGPRPAIARALVTRMAARLPITIELADGGAHGAGGPGAPVLRVRNPPAFFARVGSGTAGFAESYMAGDWDCADLPALFAVLAAHLPELVPAPARAFRRLYVRGRPAHEDDTVDGARRNIQRHYDLSNELFQLFLDSTMSYSSALFEPGDTLERAQARKIDRLLDLTQVGPGTRLLEIGTGWGELATRAATRGAVVTTLTNSAAQCELARERVAKAGLADRVDLRLGDYRELRGSYDAIVSVEMVEAVGPAYWPVYFAALDRLLVPGGRVGLQAITMPHDRMLATMHGQTWIHKYIFPGGHIPSRQAISDSLRAYTSLSVTSEFAMGRHYATTLARWRDRLAQAQGAVLGLGFSPAFLRMWDLYLAYSEAGFRSGYLDVWQFGLERRGDH
jgi:cyclopropane-fatty-acyl-phospholipid synthase